MAAAELPMANWVVLQPGVPVRLHFKDHRFVERVIMDSIFGVPKKVKTLMFLVDEEGGRPVEKSFSVVSGKLADDLYGYLEGKHYRGYTFTLIKDAPGTVAPRIVEALPR